MPRPQRCRRVCREPAYSAFSPEGVEDGTPLTVELTTDEFEVIRLVDYEKKTHEACAAQMDISRTTVTEIYEAARWKLADCLLNGRRLAISGGNYRLCDGTAQACCQKRCGRRGPEPAQSPLQKGEQIMRIAVTYENGEIFQHFGHTEQFKLYDAENGKIVSSCVVSTNGSGHGALAAFLAANGVDVLICGGIGGGAQTALAQAGIRLYGGASGPADEAAAALLENRLVFQADVRCSHHDHEHGAGEHTCGEHGCGNHSGH